MNLSFRGFSLQQFGHPVFGTARRFMTLFPPATSSVGLQVHRYTYMRLVGALTR